MDLEIGDELTSSSGAVTLKGRCGKAVFVFKGQFRVRFLQLSNDRCGLFDYSKTNSQMNVKSSAPTSVRSGETRMFSNFTQYEIRITSNGRRRRTRQWIVYEGEIDVQSRGFSKTVRGGEKLVATGTVLPSIQKIAPEDIEQAATVYARIDVSQTNISDAQELERAFAKLRKLRIEVLADPKNEQKQTLLANGQRELGIPDNDLGPQPEGQANEWNGTLERDTKTTIDFTLTNNCQKASRFRLILKNLPFIRLPSVFEYDIRGRAKIDTPLEFDTTGMKPGVYQGVVDCICVNCETDCPRCVGLQINLKVIDKQPQSNTSKERNPPLSQ
jgi:hypothetical protein